MKTFETSESYLVWEDYQKLIKKLETQNHFHRTTKENYRRYMNEVAK